MYFLCRLMNMAHPNREVAEDPLEGLKHMATKKRQGTNQITFGVRLRKTMDERSLTVRAIAEMAGVNSSVVQSWISKAVPHDLEAVARLAKALNIGFKELLLGEPEMAESPEMMFDAEDWFEGLCKVSIQRLVPKKKT